MKEHIVNISLREAAHREAEAFLDFLRKTAKNHSVALSFSTSRAGDIRCSCPSKDGSNLDLFLQELTFDRALYYYLCTVTKRRETAKAVVVPVMTALLQSRFNLVYPSLLRKQISGGKTPGELAAAEFSDHYGQEYEKLFQQQKLKMISNYEFIRNLDDLLTDFMLFQLEYKRGTKTPQFNLLVDECGRKQIVWEKNVREWFKLVHSFRTRGLHRREREIADTQVMKMAYDFYNVFQYFSDYFEAQEDKTVILRGKRYRRIRYGDKREWQEFSGYSVGHMHPCHDCGVLKGALHLDGCDWEQCPRCKGQYLGCPCKFEEEEDAAMIVSKGVNQLCMTDATT